MLSATDIDDKFHLWMDSSTVFPVTSFPNTAQVVPSNSIDSALPYAGQTAVVNVSTKLRKTFCLTG